MRELDRKALKEALDRLPPRPWTVRTSCSFRRITGPDGKEGGVLHAYNQRSDGHPDLSMSEEKLEALCQVINEAPALLASLEEAEGRLEDFDRANAMLADARNAIRARADAAEQRERRLREALEWYADPISYAITQAREPRSAVHGDDGRRARAALSEEEA